MKAFPYEESYNHGGMDLRDYFAAKAMQAFIIKGIVPAESLTKKQAIVSMAFETADAMMEARNEQVR